jgi:hypothetical protein
MTTRTEWRPHVEELPGRRKQAELEARTEALRQKHDAITLKDLRDLLDLDWGKLDRLEHAGLIETFDIEEPNRWRKVKKSNLPVIKAHLEVEAERKAQRKAEGAAQKRERNSEPRIKL